MTYNRVISRNGFHGNYKDSAVAGDLRRMEDDQRDENFLELYAKYAGITEEQAKKVLDAFFDDGLLYNITKDKPWVDTNGRHNYHD